MAIVHRAIVHEDEHTFPATMARRIVFYVLDVIEVLLAFRFFLRLLAANGITAETATLINRELPKKPEETKP